MKFTITKKDKTTKARTGKLITGHGIVKTPVFIPVATTGTVKAVHQRELEQDVKSQIILCNAYHLFVRPGLQVIEKAGGLHKFIGWDKPILTDSGGYQVYSLAENRKITEEGVSFQSHVDGLKHFFTPESVIDIQRTIGADIIMAFDECAPYPCEYNYAKNSMELTHRWLKKCCERFDVACSMMNKSCRNKEINKYDQTLFPIVQGSVYKDLRKQSAEIIASYDREGNAIGGLSVGEPTEIMYEMTEVACHILPENKPRYLMGVGTPANILECIALGIDMFDCVIPTRNGRNGMLYTKKGIINIRNEKWKNDYSPIDIEGAIFVDSQYTKAYLHYLFNRKEILGLQIASLHNLSFYRCLIEEAKKKITDGTFYYWKNKMVNKLDTRI
ncbi:MAG: tRNA guanosine(34) transglycosylase Tgt [Bacteroidota bacterium]